jgi:hypothetical protein
MRPSPQPASVIIQIALPSASVVTFTVAAMSLYQAHHRLAGARHV